ncbi:MAG: type II toxin-antitoxin system RelE/ParE family toxin [Oscillospiraceae bacterium]|nr:type II toxin-antitoxin system RelE/ParE family toxin [Oscillospiraceae bacterium]
MKIIYKTKKLERICTDAKTAIKVYGREMANKIHQRIDEISAADSIEMMLRFHIGRCHQLSQNRKGQFAVDLIHPYRLVFEKIGEEIQAVQIIEIVDYH